jgi:tRNA modification GTPase
VSSDVFQHQDTIVAVATAPGRGAISLVRLSGPDAFAIAAKHVRHMPGEPRLAQLSGFFRGSEKLDEALVTLYPAPNSFTGDDTVELSTHGGSLVPNSIVAALTESGARQALAGEFTRRAVLNGKLDLVQAEAIGDLIDASSRAMQRAAINQLDGGLSRRLIGLRDKLLELESLIAYDVDFPEEDDGPIPRARVEAAAASVLELLDQLISTAPVGEIVREGAVVVIAGPPNAGKSSLFNALIGRSRAIVTDIPGTTRDALEGVVDTGKWPLRLVDTAGLRHTDDRIEKLGIEVSERYLSSAEVVLACAENVEGLEQISGAIAERTGSPMIRVRTKADLVANSEYIPSPVISVSAETGSGLKELLAAIDSAIDQRQGILPHDLPILTRVRHRKALEAALEEVARFLEAWRSQKLPATVAAVHLRTAVSELEELVGTLDVDAVLDRLFSSFCVGK